MKGSYLHFLGYDIAGPDNLKNESRAFYYDTSSQ